VDDGEFSCELRKTPSYELEVHDTVEEELAPLLVDEHGVQDTTRGSNANTPR
jgi:hypothetical protein